MKLLQLKTVFKQSKFIAIAGYALLGLALTSCAKQEYQKVQYERTGLAVGFRYLPAKVDILFVVDNTASVNNAVQIMQSQLGNFVNSIQSKYWDYHIAKMTIANPSPINQVLVNPEFNTNRLKDGTYTSAEGIVPSDRAVTSASSFSILPGISYGGSADETYKNMYNILVDAKADKYTNFLRNNVPLVIILVTNGVDYTVDPDGYGMITSTGTSKLLTYANQLISLKGSSNLVRFYPIAAYRQYSSGCLTSGGTAWKGSSYFMMNNYLPGLPQYDGASNELLNFCNSTSVTNVLTSIENDLKVTQESYVRTRLVIDEDFEPSSLNIAIDGKGIAANDAVNGWTYNASAGVQTVCTITHKRDQTTGIITPLTPCLNPETGYVVELHGSARLIGSNQPSITYTKK